MFQTVDDDRFTGRLRGGKVTCRVEVWSAGQPIEDDAPFVSGLVTDTWVMAGVRRNLSLTVAPSVDWLKWLELPLLELRPFRGIEFRAGDVSECPLGRFPVEPPERSLPAATLSIPQDDYYQRITDAKFSFPVQTSTQPVVSAIISLFYNSGSVFAGLRDPVNLSTTRGVAAGVLLERTRHDAIVDYAKSFGLEVFVDRNGVPTIADAQVLGAPVVDLTAVAEKVTVKPDSSKVFNQVAVTSSAQGVEFPAQVAVVGADSPAAQWRIGAKVLLYSSPVITTQAAALAAAKTILGKVSGAALTYTYVCAPDPRLDAGDSVMGPSPTGDTVVNQIAAVTHPLTVDGRQQVTTVSTQVPV